MVHRSGSTHQYEELFANEESNSKAKNDLQIAESFKTASSSNINSATVNQTEENESKRPLRTSKRLCSINPDVMTPPKLCEFSSSSSSSASNCTSKTTSTTDTLMTFATNLIPLTVKPKSIRNRRYTINDCVHPSEKSISVPFEDQKKLQVTSSTTDELLLTTRSRIGGIKSVDDFNIKKNQFSCSVSLERLTGIVDTISTKALLSNDCSDKDDSTSTNKVFCLYCDRTFSSLKLYGMHVERVHQRKSGRRISARTINNAPTLNNYPGCSYCNVGKVTCLESDELMQLVHHLIQQHGDKYFACDKCMVRFQTRELLQKHASSLHGYNDAKLKKESQRKTSKNVQSMTNTSPPTSSSSSSSLSSTTSPSSSSSSSSTSSSSSSSSSSFSTGTTIAIANATTVTPLTIQVDFDPNDVGDQSSLRNRLRRSNDLKAKSERSTRRQLLSSEETFLSRLGIGLNRSPRSRKGAKNRRGCSSELFESSRSTRGNKNSKQTIPNNHDTGDSSKPVNNKIEPIVPAFDEDFYESVNQNVKYNLSCHLDGKLDSDPMSASPLSPVASVPTVRSILVKSPLITESEIHEATTISAFTAFPTLLTAQQHGSESLTPGKIKKPITKHSWKWKWDCVKKYKYVNEGGKIVKKIKQSTCGMRDLSTLDMWTQLTMRMRHEVAVRQENQLSGEDNIMGIGEAARQEKRKLIEQLNKILDTRIVPMINVEQSDQSIIKQEAIEELRCNDRNTINTLSSCNSINDTQRDPEFPTLMNLIKRERNDNLQSSIILSGEWARPRCYICFGCGSLFSTVRTLEEHKASKHPYVHSTHYEIVGKELIDGNLFRNFYIPSLALQRHNNYNKKQFFNNSICNTGEESMDSVTSSSMSLTKSDSFDLDSNSRNSKVSISSVASVSDRSYSASADDENANSSSEQALTVATKSCSKCNRECKGTLDLYRHMLDCSSDYAWILAKKRNNIKYRYFGAKRRRQQRSSSQSARKISKPKKERRNSDTSASQKSKEPSTPRQRPSDAESIQRMLANLPAKRAVRQIFPNLTPKPKNKNKKLLPNALNRKKILLKQKTKGNSRGFKVVSTSSTTINSVGTNLALRKKRNVETANAVVRRTRSSLNATVSTAKISATSKVKSANNGRKSMTSNSATTTSPALSTSSSASMSSSSLSSSSKNPTNGTATKNKQINNDLSSMFRRRTKAVVTKLTNTLRRGQKQRLLRTTTHHSPNTSKNTNNAKLDKNKLKTKSKKTFLRTLSFRRSNRNINKMEKANISTATAAIAAAPTENKKPNDESNSKNAVDQQQSTSTESLESENKPSKKSDNDDSGSSSNNKKSDTNIVTSSEESKTKAETIEKIVEANSEKTSKTAANSVPPAPETPRLKRKRSIKTIINEMRAKCQNQTNATDEPVSVLTDDTKTDGKQLTFEISTDAKNPITEPSSYQTSSETTILPSRATSSTPVTMPLSLTIGSLDEPLNLCISPQKNLNAANSVKEVDDKTIVNNKIQPPEQHLDNISPRRRTRKLNDCIAMLTGKLQEKLGVPFIDQTSILLPILSPSSEHAQSKPINDRQDKEKTSPANVSNTAKSGSIEEILPLAKEKVEKKTDKVDELSVKSISKSNEPELMTETPQPVIFEKIIKPIEESNQCKKKETKPNEESIDVPVNEKMEMKKTIGNKLDKIEMTTPIVEDSKTRQTRKSGNTSRNVTKNLNKIDKSVIEKQVELPLVGPTEMESEKKMEVVNELKSTDTKSINKIDEVDGQEKSLEIEHIDKALDENEQKKQTTKNQQQSKTKASKRKFDTSKVETPNPSSGDENDKKTVDSNEAIDLSKVATEVTINVTSENVVDVLQKSTPKSKKKSAKQKDLDEKSIIVESNIAPETIVEVANVSEIKSIAIGIEVDDIENEIKTNIIPNERINDSKKASKKKITPKKNSENETLTMCDKSIEKLETKVNRMTRSGKQPIEDEKSVESPLPSSEEKKTPTKATKLKESGSIDVISKSKEKDGKKKIPSKVTEKSMVKIVKKVVNEPLVEESNKDEPQPNEKPVKNMSVNEKVQNLKSSKLSSKEMQNKKSKNKLQALKKVDKKNESETEKPLPEVTMNSQESSELKEDDENATQAEKLQEPTVDVPSAENEKCMETIEKPKSNKKQCEKTTAKTDKNNKKKTKKMKNGEKSVNQNSKISQPDTINFDNSDDELLPWDPEKGFIQTTEVTAVDAEESANIETSTTIAVDAPEMSIAQQESEKDFAPKSAPKPKKKRKSELAQIIADQLLESFKEVDQSRVDELKRIQDLPFLHDEAELISTSLSTTPIPKRKSKKLFDNIKPKNSEKRSSSKSKSDEHKKLTTPKESDENDVSVLESSLMEENSQNPEERKSEQEIEEPTVNKGKKEKKSSKKKSSKKEAKKKTNNETNAVAETSKLKKVTSKIANDLSNTPFNDDINNKSFVTTNTSNIHDSSAIVDKVSEKSLFSESTEQQSNEKLQNQVKSSTISDTMSADSSEKSKSNSIFVEVLLSQKKERLNDIIGLADKEALSRVPSIKNVVFPQWQSVIDKPAMNVADNDNVMLPNESKLNFWGRSSPTSASDKSGKTRIFGVVKNRAKDLFSRISRKKLKKSIKTSIRSSSSSSSSSYSSNSSINAPKKPLLRPSILSCNNFRETLTVKIPSDASVSSTVPKQQLEQKEQQQNSTASINDIFDSLRNEKSASNLISPQTLEVPRKNVKRKEKNNKNATDKNPKSPIESDMNIAKIAIALEKSNRKELHNQVSQNLNSAFVIDKTIPSCVVDAAAIAKVTKTPKKSITTTAEKKSIAAAVVATTEKSPTPSSFLSSLQNDDSQDTIISQIVSKIREKADRTDSDDELCLADVAKGLPNQTKSDSNEFSVTSPSPSPSNDLSEAAVQNDISALVSNINKNLEESAKQEIEKSVELSANELKHDKNAAAIENDDSDDENTNTELIDMDLEDNESVYTAFSQSTSITSGGGVKKKRRKKSILSSSRKSKKDRERRLFASPTISYFCDICNKSFRNQNGLNNHKATITHISKLSEQEFLNSKEKQNENKLSTDEQQQITVTKEEKVKTPTLKGEKILNSEKTVSLDNIVPPVKIVVPPETHENIQSSVIRSSPVKTNSTSCSPYVSPHHINPSAIEPISSPEQSSRFNGTPKNNLTPSSLNSRLTLSQEERLFYECCSMLKGSDRQTVGLNMPPDIITKPVTPKCNEQTSNIIHAAQSPRSHSSPRPGLPKLDINQFSDISSDSNPAYSCPQVPSSSKTHKVFSLERSTPSKAPVDSRDKDINMFGARQTNENTDVSASDAKVTRSSISSSYPHSSTIVRNYPDSYSDMGDSFPSSQDASESENYAQTILERSNHFPKSASKVTHNTPQKGEGSHYIQASLPHENVDFRSFSNRSHLDSPLHSTSSQSSSLSRPRTKAALKGYENLKVSIPTSGLDLQHALDRSPNSNGCKLATLADIALGNDVPFDMIEPRTLASNEKSSLKMMKSPQKLKASTKSSTSKQPTLFMVSSDNTKLHSMELKTKSFEATFHVSPRTRKRAQSIGKKTGYKDRKKKCRTTGKVKLSSKIVESSKPKDVYDFEESHDSVEDEIIPMSHTRPNKPELHSTPDEPSSKPNETPKKPSDDQEDESSYSDRDDYYNFNSVSGSGTEDQENPVEEDENSDRETTQSSKSTKQVNNSQKKCLIMGRIFKNAKKNSETIPVESKDKPMAQKPIPKNELDEIFDNLKNKSPARVSSRSKTPKNDAVKSESNANDLVDEQTEQSKRAANKSRKSREVANLEAEWGMSVEQIKGIIGVGMRKAQRRCTTNRQNKLVETWSSDEYEEFHTTKDIIALIQEAEMKAQRSKARSQKQNSEAKANATGSATIKKSENNESISQKPTKPASDSKKGKSKESNRKVKIEEPKSSNDDTNEINETIEEDTIKPSKVKKTSSEKFQSEDESDFDEHWNKTAKRSKIRNRRRTIMSREDLIEKKSTKIKSKEKSVKKSTSKSKQSISEKKKPVKEPDNLNTSPKSISKITKDGKPMPRRKRIASEMLYYWSSSSDEEFGRIEADSENDDEDNSENHLEQHGWIVGDSHKKLVTLLAHAKHKKIEDCGVKESVHKRK